MQSDTGRMLTRPSSILSLQSSAGVTAQQALGPRMPPIRDRFLASEMRAPPSPLDIPALETVSRRYYLRRQKGSHWGCTHFPLVVHSVKSAV